MFLTEYDQEKVLEQERRDAEKQRNERIAKNMLRDGEPLLKIVKYSELAEDVIRALAEKIGAAIA